MQPVTSVKQPIENNGAERNIASKACPAALAATESATLRHDVPPLSFSGVQIPASDAAEPEEAPAPVSPYSQVTYSSRSGYSSELSLSTPETTSPRRRLNPIALSPPRRRNPVAQMMPALPTNNSSVTPRARFHPTLNLNLGVTPEQDASANSNSLPSPLSQRRESLGQEPRVEYDRNALMARVKRICSVVIPDKLYLSGEAVAQDLATLTENRITHILNTAGDTCPNYYPSRFIYLTFVLQDSRLTNEALEAVLFLSLSFIDKVISSGGRVLVHCREGVSRSATHVVAYLMWKQKLSFHAALELVRECRDVCNPNTGFTFTLLKLAKRLSKPNKQLPTSDGSLLSAPGERKLCRVTLHHLAAPFVVVLGVSLFEHSQGIWMPSGEGLILDPRFFYVLRDGYTFYVWHGHKVPKHLLRVLQTTIQRFLDDVKYFESINDSDFQVVKIVSGTEPETFWQLIRPNVTTFANASRVSELHLLDEEAEAMATGIPEASIFSPAVWEEQLKQSGTTESARRGTFTFQPPKTSPRMLHSGGSKKITIDCRASDSLSMKSVGLRLPTDSSSNAAQRASIANSLKTLASATAIQATGEGPESDGRLPGDGVGRDESLERHLTYLFVCPDFVRAEVAVDEDCLQSDQLLLFVRFGNSARPCQLSDGESPLSISSYSSTNSVEDFDSREDAGSRPGRRALTVPPFKAVPLNVPKPVGLQLISKHQTEIRSDLSGGDYHSAISHADETEREDDLWMSRIWLWKGSQSPPLEADEQKNLISAFCALHNISIEETFVSIEEEDKESDAFLKLVYLG